MPRRFLCRLKTRVILRASVCKHLCYFHFFVAGTVGTADIKVQCCTKTIPCYNMSRCELCSTLPAFLLAHNSLLSAKQPTLHYRGHGKPVRPSLFKETASSPSPIIEAAVRRFMSPDARPIFQRHWEEAKERLGPWKAGLTLKSFIEKNTKVSGTISLCTRPSSDVFEGD
jgi:hypothetical protein